MNDTELSSALERWTAGRDMDARDALVEQFLPLAYAIARKFTGLGVELEDLQQVGAMALLKALERYELDKGVKFSTFATPTIVGEIRNYIRDKGRSVRLSRNTQAQIIRMRQLQDQLTRDLRREPTLKELAAAMDITYDELLRLMDARQSTEIASLSSPVNAEEDAMELQERLGEQDEGYERVEQQQWMQWVFSQVSETEKKLLELRFLQRLGQRDTARSLGVSQMQVSRMERRILTRLREHTEHWQTTY